MVNFREYKVLSKRLAEKGFLPPPDQIKGEPTNAERLVARNNAMVQADPNSDQKYKEACQSVADKVAAYDKKTAEKGTDITATQLRHQLMSFLKSIGLLTDTEYNNEMT